MALDYKKGRVVENEDGTVTVEQKIFLLEETTEDEPVLNESTGEYELTAVTRDRRTQLLDVTEYDLEL